MWNDGRSWEYIFAHLLHRSEGSLRVRYSTKFKKRPRARAGRSWTGEAADCFISFEAPLSEVEPSSSEDDDDWSDGDSDFGDLATPPRMPLEHEQAEPMVRRGPATLASIQENSWEWIFGKFSGRTWWIGCRSTNANEDGFVVTL
jgi:hypothetical protein